MRVAMPQRQPDKNGFLERAARENPVVVASQSSPREISPESVRRGASRERGRGDGGRGSPPPRRHRRAASRFDSTYEQTQPTARSSP